MTALLGVGETWTWSGLATGNLTVTTTFEATGHGLDPAGNDVTYPAVPGERASTTVTVSNTAGNDNINGTHGDQWIGHDVNGNGSESRYGALSSAHVVVLKNGAAFMDLVAPPTNGDTGMTAYWV